MPYILENGLLDGNKGNCCKQKCSETNDAEGVMGMKWICTNELVCTMKIDSFISENAQKETKAGSL